MPQHDPTIQLNDPYMDPNSQYYSDPQQQTPPADPYQRDQWLRARDPAAAGGQQPVQQGQSGGEWVDVNDALMQDQGAPLDQNQYGDEPWWDQQWGASGPSTFYGAAPLDERQRWQWHRAQDPAYDFMIEKGRMDTVRSNYNQGRSGGSTAAELALMWQEPQYMQGLENRWRAGISDMAGFQSDPANQANMMQNRGGTLSDAAMSRGEMDYQTGQDRANLISDVSTELLDIYKNREKEPIL